MSTTKLAITSPPPASAAIARARPTTISNLARRGAEDDRRPGEPLESGAAHEPTDRGDHDERRQLTERLDGLEHLGIVGRHGGRHDFDGCPQVDDDG